MVEVHKHPTKYRIAELVTATVGPLVVIGIVVSVGLLMQHNLKVGMAVALIIASVGCFAITTFLALGWVGLSILGRFAGNALDRIGIVCFSVTGIVLAVVSIVSLLK